METTRQVAIRLGEERFPPYDALHGTPQEMVRRTLEFELPDGTSRWEQSDYGHPGRFGDWEPRGIDARLQSKTAKLKAAAEAIGDLLGDWKRDSD